MIKFIYLNLHIFNKDYWGIKMSETKVKLIKQKYNEFASHGLEQELELIKLVSTVAFDKMENDNKIYPLSTIENAEKYLRKNA